MAAAQTKGHEEGNTPGCKEKKKTIRIEFYISLVVITC